MDAHLPLHQHRFRAMGSQIVIWLQHTDADEARDACTLAEDLFAAAEQRMSRFLPHSELSQLNARSGEWVTVSRLLWQVISHALLLAQETGGLFDPTIGNALLAGGYTASFSPTQRQLNGSDQANAEPLIGRWRQVELDPLRHAVRVPAGLRLDLGGIGKGYTAQMAVDLLALWGPCLVDAGGDVVAGDGPAGQPGWLVGVAHPSEQDAETAMELWLNNATLATSGIDYRWWWQNGRRQHHLIDPRTGQAAQTDLLTATVLAADGSEAEAWATASLVMGRQPSLTLAAEQHRALIVADETGVMQRSAAVEPFVARRYVTRNS